jgi:phosphoenolpyruvate phosphomutase
MITKARALATLFAANRLDFLMGAHDALSAQIAEDCGFPGVWVSGLGLSAASGLRDSNELSWTQVVERIELIADRLSIPCLVDIDTGYGDFNNVRLVMRRFRRFDVGGACIEDKMFPKTNSLLDSAQQLADPAEFCGRLKAAKDTTDGDVYLVARCEALVAGHSLSEAVDRCARYVDAGADAVLIHSKKSSVEEILDFMAVWDGRAPVSVVPTKYSHVSPDVLEQAGISVAIWANQSLRAAIKGMQRLCSALRSQRTMRDLEGDVVELSRVFELTDQAELDAAKQRYTGAAPTAGPPPRQLTSLVAATPGPA